MIKIFKSKLFSGSMILLIGWVGYSFTRIKIQEAEVNEEVSNLEAKVVNLEKNNSSLEKFIEYLKHPLYLEREARLKFNYKAPDEEVAFVYPDMSSKSFAIADFRSQLAQMPNYLKWLYFLLGY